LSLPGLMAGPACVVEEEGGEGKKGKKKKKKKKKEEKKKKKRPAQKRKINSIPNVQKRGERTLSPPFFPFSLFSCLPFHSFSSDAAVNKKKKGRGREKRRFRFHFYLKTIFCAAGKKRKKEFIRSPRSGAPRAAWGGEEEREKKKGPLDRRIGGFARSKSCRQSQRARRKRRKKRGRGDPLRPLIGSYLSLRFFRGCRLRRESRTGGGERKRKGEKKKGLPGTLVDTRHNHPRRKKEKGKKALTLSTIVSRGERGGEERGEVSSLGLVPPIFAVSAPSISPWPGGGKGGGKEGEKGRRSTSPGDQQEISCDSGGKGGGREGVFRKRPVSTLRGEKEKRGKSSNLTYKIV